MYTTLGHMPVTLDSHCTQMPYKRAFNDHLANTM